MMHLSPGRTRPINCVFMCDASHFFYISKFFEIQSPSFINKLTVFIDIFSCAKIKILAVNKGINYRMSIHTSQKFISLFSTCQSIISRKRSRLGCDEGIKMQLAVGKIKK